MYPGLYLFANFVKQISWQKRHHCLAIRSRYFVDNLRNQIKFSFTYQSSDFYWDTLWMVLPGLNTGDSMTLDQMNLKNVGLPLSSVVLTESYPPRLAYQSFEVILVHIKWPFKRCFVLSRDLWKRRKYSFFLSRISTKVHNFEEKKSDMFLAVKCLSSIFFFWLKYPCIHSIGYCFTVPTNQTHL